MFSLLLRNLFFTIIQPGIVVGLIPYWILRKQWYFLFPPAQWHQYTGIFIFVTGFVVMSHCILRFATKGRGTLSPADPTRHLVISGLYKYSRNPMYVGVMLMLVGEGIFSLSKDIWFYSLLVFLAFNLFIFIIEEPRLRKDFGEEYVAYCQKVRRWL